MDPLEEIEAEVNAKLFMMKFTRSKTGCILEKGSVKAVARHRDTMRVLVNEVDSVKLKVEQANFDKGETAEDVGKWSHDVDEQDGEVDSEITRLEKWLKEMTLDAEDKEHKAKEADELRARQKQLKFEHEQLQIKLEFKQKLEETRPNQASATKGEQSIQTKLPKLELTKFNGTYAAWLPFWNKFQAEIDKSSLAPVTKFAYLNELVISKVRTEIDRLPFTTEGYERAKNILTSEYRRDNEIVNAYIQSIMELSVITETRPTKIHDFYKKLVFNVQSLKTLGRLKDIKGNVRSVLDKLKGIKADLVRGHPDW